MSVLLAGLGGFISSCVPELFNYFKDKQDKKHELNVLDKQLDIQKVDSNNKLEAVGIQADVSETAALMKTYNVGIQWVDALNGTVRPVIAYFFFILYASLKVVATFNFAPQDITFNELYTALWTQDDAAIFAGIISFYYGQRAISKLRKR